MANITIDELCSLYLEDSEEMTIYDPTSGKTVFSGTFDEAMFTKYGSKEVCSFGIEDGEICINIELED